MIKVELVVNYNNMPKLKSAMRQEADKAIKATVAEGVELAKKNAPVDTGALQDEIHGEDEGDLTGSVVSSIDYAIFNELGTVKMAPQPYMTPMAEVMKSKFIDRMSKVVESAASG